MKKKLQYLLAVIMLVVLLPSNAFAAAEIRSSDATETVQGRGTKGNPWIVTVGNTYTIKTGKKLGSSDCLDANWYVTGDNTGYIEIVGEDFNTVNPQIKTTSSSGDKIVFLTAKHQTCEVGVDLNVWTKVDYYYFKIQAAGTNANGGQANNSFPSQSGNNSSKPSSPSQSDNTSSKPSSPSQSDNTSSKPSSPSQSDNTSSNSGSSGRTCGANAVWSLENNTLTISGFGAIDAKFQQPPWQSDADHIETVTIQSGITKIGSYAFYDCKKLENILIPDTVSSIGAGAFEECSSLEYLTLPDSLTAISSFLFDQCSSLKSLDIPDNVTKIGVYAFDGCKALESISIPAGVTKIESNAFRNCPNLKDIYYEGAQWNSITIGDNNDALSRAKLHAENTSNNSTDDSDNWDDDDDFNDDEDFDDDDDEPSVAPSSKLYTNEWYAKSMNWAQENSITQDADYQKPNARCNRSNIVLFLWRAEGCPSASGDAASFIDISPDVAYYNALKWAVGAGIINGFDDGSFRPDGSVTRAQLVTILYRSQDAAESSSANIAFADVPSDAWFTEAVRWAVKNSITNGTGANTFSPNDVCTTAQVITFLYRLQNL